MSFSEDQDKIYSSFHHLAETVPIFSHLLTVAKSGDLNELKKNGEKNIDYIVRSGNAKSHDDFYIPDGNIILESLISIAYAASLAKLQSHEAKPYYSNFVDGLIEANNQKMRTSYGLLHHVLEWDAFEQEKDGRKRLLSVTGTFALRQARASHQGKTTAYGLKNYCEMAINAAKYGGLKSPIKEIEKLFS